MSMFPCTCECCRRWAALMEKQISQAPQPAATGAGEYDRELIASQALLEWNRALPDPIIRVGYEYVVAAECLRLIAANEPNTAAPGMGGWKFTRSDLLGSVVVTYPNGHEVTFRTRDIGAVIVAKVMEDMANALAAAPVSASGLGDSDIAQAEEWVRSLAPRYSDADAHRHTETILEALAAYDPSQVGARTAAQPAPVVGGDWYSRVPNEARFTASLDGGIVQDNDGPWVMRSEVDKAILSTLPAESVAQGGAVRQPLPVPADMMEARAQGRAEALAILLRMDAEEGLDDYTVSTPPGPAGEWGTAWDDAKLRDLFKANDSAYSLLLEAEGEYWHNLGLREEAEHHAKIHKAHATPTPATGSCGDSAAPLSSGAEGA